MNKIRKALQSAYKELENKRKEYARKQAEQLALDNNDTTENWLKYYEAPAPLHVGLGTVEGLTNHFAILESNPIGSANITNSEIGSELANNPNFIDIVKQLSIGYDLGKIPIKVVKAVENRVKAIESLPINCLFFGSEDAILYDNNLKSKFKLIFNTQLARRTLFSFSKERTEPKQFTSIEELAAYHEQQRQQSAEAITGIDDYLVDMIKYTNQTPLTLTKETQLLFDTYLEYNKNLAETVNSHYPITKLSRKHKQWLALKLSGNYAILDGSDVIEPEHYIYAINTVELLAPSLISFEHELNKDTYEQFVDYCHLHAEEGKLLVPIHTLRKLGYIPSTNIINKIDELLELASSYDSLGVYTIDDEGIQFEQINTTNEYYVSQIKFRKQSNESDKSLKARMTKSCNTGFKLETTTFSDLSKILQSYTVYTPFAFKEGKRSRDNLYGTTKWIVLDVDNSSITDEEAHLLLSDINHHIARTSDASNPFKFRILIELDIQVDIPTINWKYFIESISNELGIQVDLLPKAQVYFAYKAEIVLSVTNAQPLAVKQHIINASKRKPPVVTKDVPKKQKESALNNQRETFAYAYEAPDGQGSRSLVQAGLHAIDLGADWNYIEHLINDINHYWVIPLDEDRLQKTVLAYLQRKYQQTKDD